MTYRSHIVGPSRVFDHIYDPLFIASDRKDICRANNVALSRSAPIGIFPVYQTMFSELPRMTRNHYVMHRNPLPYYPDVQVKSGCKPPQINDLSRILGTERSKFFCHPTAGESGTLVKMSDSIDDFCHCDQSVEPRCRDVGSQTVYRESSAQTQPWMPSAVLKDADFGTAEIVYVAEVIQHTRYPGINEVEIIERARKKRSWEYALGSCDSVEEWAQQKLVLQIFEWEEWVARERQIDRYQMLRLQLVAKIMEKRERDTKQATESKMENTKNRINAERNKAMEKLRINHERNIRKLEKKRMDSKANKFQSTHSSKADEPSALMASSKKGQCKKSYHYDPNLIEVGLTKLERKTTVAHKLSDVNNQRPELWKPKQVCRESQKGFWSDHFLKKLYESLKHFRHMRESKPLPPECLIVVSSPTESTLTSPPILSEEREDDLLYQQAVLLQKLLRGRATQEMIHKDYAADRDMVEDLIATHRLPVVEEFFPIDAIKTGSVREKYLHILRNEQLLDEFIETSTHAQMTSLMTTLERELSRLQNERNAQAFYLLTEQERYFREARETRHISEMKFQDNEELAVYLENALLERVDEENLDQTRAKIHEMVRKFDTEADQRISSVDEPDRSQDNIASYLMDEMMIPDIFRRAVRENIRLKQKPLLAEAQEAIFQKVELKPLDSVPEEVMEALKEETEEKQEAGDIQEMAPDLETRNESQIIIEGLLSNVIESALSENEVEEIPEDETTDFFGLGVGAESEEEAEQVAIELLDDILSHVLEASET
ncbi:cilia- and flagella-associated protein 91-like [Toxorhynchites rutilus septentrionalis]|uniref:cilia- and flagella-associated protein 91-like n=1 Tax=Toxorhynchites rutilus septentrionalis TaxID=329112 RepID=UPI00247938AF|nr:cilia- and flagella-associated protein 91-like [Toxorhynchites rutilus septentrionalis]